tara:strand:+ start:893 stop:1135 length:243 start_codon:yes stop_codon:yes gene_type:complete
MKRKRQPTNDVNRSRPFQKKVELLNECLCLTLKYNTEFGYSPTDLSLYRYAEKLASEADISSFNKKMEAALATRQELTGI